MNITGMLIICICIATMLITTIVLVMWSGKKFIKKYYTRKKYPMTLECEYCGAIYETDSKEWVKDFRYFTKTRQKGFGLSFLGNLGGASVSYPTRYSQKRVCPNCQKETFQNVLNISDIVKQNTNISFYGGYAIALFRILIPAAICMMLITTPLITHFENEYDLQHRPKLTYEEVYQQKLDAGYSEEEAKYFADEWQKEVNK